MLPSTMRMMRPEFELINEELRFIGSHYGNSQRAGVTYFDV